MDEGREYTYEVTIFVVLSKLQVIYFPVTRPHGTRKAHTLATSSRVSGLSCLVAMKNKRSD